VSLAWMWYSDSIFGSGDDLEAGIKENQGYKEFMDNCGVWKHLSKKDQSMKNNQSFTAVDKSDKNVAAAISIQSGFRGAKDRKALREMYMGQGLPEMTDEELAARDAEIEAGITTATQVALAGMKDNSIKWKADRQLSRAEFLAALVKTAIERYFKTKRNPNGELNDVSDAVERLFAEHIEPALQTPLTGCSQPVLPLPDTFRDEVCYKEDVTMALEKIAPTSLRVIFAGLAKISLERSRDGPPSGVLPKIKNNTIIKHDNGVAWIKTNGLISYKIWCDFIKVFNFAGLNLRELSVCFTYSVMCVIDSRSKEGGRKERHLPFEGFLEAICRLTTVVALPTDHQLKAANVQHAGTYMQTVSETATNEMIEDQRSEWGGVPNPAEAGETSRRLVHFTDILVRAIKPPKEPDDVLTPLTRKEFRGWALKEFLSQREAEELPAEWEIEGQKMKGESPDLAHTGTKLDYVSGRR